MAHDGAVGGSLAPSLYVSELVLFVSVMVWFRPDWIYFYSVLPLLMFHGHGEW